LHGHIISLRVEEWTHKLAYPRHLYWRVCTKTGKWEIILLYAKATCINFVSVFTICRLCDHAIVQSCCHFSKVVCFKVDDLNSETSIVEAHILTQSKNCMQNNISTCYTSKPPLTSNHWKIIPRRITLTIDNGDVSLVVSTSRSFPHSWFTTGFVTKVTRRVSLVSLFTLPEHMRSPLVKGVIRQSNENREHNGQKNRAKGQVTTTYKTLYRKLKIEPHEPH
jgi:hypothetical protein